MTELVARLTSDEHGFVAVLPELDGVEGFGTTALAAAACHILEVAEHFGDGIDWLTVGAAPPHVVESLVRDRLESFGVPWITADAEPEFEEPGTGLLVLDGVRTAEQLRACLSLTSDVTVLVTARTADILPGLPSIIRLKVPDGGWPLLARLSGSLGTSVDDAFDLADPAARAYAVRKVLDAGLPSLSPGALPRLLELGAFAADSDIPASVVPAVWQRTAGLSKGASERLLAELCEAGLADHRPDRDLLLVPDVVRDYLRQASSGEAVSLTAKALIGTFTDVEEAIVEETVTDEAVMYCLAHLPDHYVAAGEDLADLVTQTGWIASKLASLGIAAVDRDLARAGAPEAERLRRTLARNAHLFTHGDRGALLPTLAARLYGDAGELREMLHAAGEPWLDCLWAPPDLPHPALVRTMRLNDERVTQVAISPDSTWIAGASWEGKARIWNLDGSLRATLSGHEDAVSSVAISADGTWLATTSWDRTVRTWLADGTPIAVMEAAHGEVQQVAIAPDGTWIAARCWSPEGAMEGVVEPALDDCSDMAMSSDGRWLAASVDRPEVFVTATVDRPREEMGFVARHALVNDLAVSRDGTLLVTAIEPSTIQVWDPAGFPARGEDHRRTIANAVAVARDGTWLATAGIGLSFWDSAGGRTATVAEETFFTSVAISPAGRWLATAGSDGLVRLFERDGPPIRTLKVCDDWADTVAIAPDGSWLAAGGRDGRARLWYADGTPLTTIKTSTEAVKHLAIAPDGTWMATAGSDRVDLWDAQGRRLAPTLKADSFVGGLAMAADGEWVAAALGDGGIALWGRTGDAVATLPGDEVLYTGLAVSASGEHLAATADDGTLRVWDVAARRCVSMIRMDGELRGCVWSPRGALYAAGDAGLYGFALRSLLAAPT
ncbi:WD40 repeat domain-containing protein [Nonomuraea dietziae]|uniref:WD40 repeat domain-containing protein n=1 Tax=Nonomuraea dietziae TaxID=65515 RepID=UPI0033ECB767